MAARAADVSAVYEFRVDDDVFHTRVHHGMHDVMLTHPAELVALLG